MVAPKAVSEEARRREYILNMLLLGVIILSIVASFLTFIQVVLLGKPGAVNSLPVTLGAAFVFSLFLWMSRKGLRIIAMYLFVGVFMVLATYPIVVWGILLPQGILIYSLIIVMSGVLLGSRIAFWMAAIITLILLSVIYMGEIGTLEFDMSWATIGADYKDGITFGVTFGIIALVSWLSNREIQHSFERVQASEKALLEERNSLERKVRERTKALEKVHVEKMLDLQRFAEFGRLSSTLLHEIANPLTSVSLDLQQLEGKNRSKLISRAREGITHMEQYVEAARRQLRNQSEIKLFDVKVEIERVAGLIEGKARAQHVAIELKLDKDVTLKGDSIRFDHIISNLLTNAVDAYDGMPAQGRNAVTVNMKHLGKEVEIIVQDFGRGITSDQIEHLFEPFYTTKESGRGTGIGLVITKEAVEDGFQGKITVAHSKRQGTRFTVRLPLA